MSRIIITTQVYPPETHPTAVMVKELAEYLTEQHWEVTVCAGLPHHPYGKLYEGWKRQIFSRTRENSVEVIRVFHLVHPNRSILIRSAVYLSQTISQTLTALFSKKADIILVYGPPLLGPNLGALIAMFHRAALVNVIYDIYPDIAVETRKITNSLIIRAASMAEKNQYRASDLTIVLSEGFKKTLIQKGVNKKRIKVIPVWLDKKAITQLSRNNAWRKEQKIDSDKFVVLYAGTIGIVSGARIVAKSAEILREHRDILFLFVGEGDEKKHVQEEAQKLELVNIRFLPFQQRERLSEVLSTADIGIVTLAPGRGRTSVPSKLLGYMAAGRPVIASVDADSDTAAEIRKHNMGIVTAPGNAQEIANAILELYKNDKLRSQFGVNAGIGISTAYSKEAVLQRYCSILAAVNRSEWNEKEKNITSIQEIAVVDMEHDHVSQVSALHLRSFKGFFLSSLGEKLLKQYYETVLDFKQIALAATINNRVIGFVTGIDSSFKFYKKLLQKKKMKFAWSLLETIADDPTILLKIAGRMKNRFRIEEKRESEPGSVVLTSIAVSDNLQGTGVAHRLMDAFKETATKRRFNRIYLETDALDNDRVRNFYKKEGFKITREFVTQEGRQMIELIFDLSGH